MLSPVVLASLFLDLAVYGIYVVYPMLLGHVEIISEDIGVYSVRTSLIDIVLLALARDVVCVGTELSRSKSGQNTRLRITILIAFYCVCMALIVAKFALYMTRDWMVAHWRRSSWGTTTYGMLLTFCLSSCLLQLWFVLRLNRDQAKSILGGDRDAMRVLMSSSGKHYRALWRRKWRKLTRLMPPRPRATPSVFTALVYLYCHTEGALDKVIRAARNDAEEFMFYIPQLCSFLLLGASADGPALTIIMLERCTESVTFAHRMWWFLNAFYRSSDSYASEEQMSRVKMLMEEASERGELAIKNMFPPFFKAHRDQTADKVAKGDRRGRAEVCEEGSHIPLLAEDREGAGEGPEGRNTGENLQNRCPVSYGATDSRVSVSSPSDSVSFAGCIAFARELTKVADKLMEVPLGERNPNLRRLLLEVNERYLPSAHLYVPVGHPYHCIQNIIVEESFSFSTKERVPCLLCVEIVDIPNHPFGLLKNATRSSKDITSDRGSSMKHIDSDTRLAGSPRRARARSDRESSLGFWSRPSPPLFASYPTLESDIVIDIHREASEKGRPGGTGLGILSPTGALRKIKRHDSTDTLLKNAELDDFNEDEDGIVDLEAPDLETSARPIIFKERWAEKEERIRAISAFSHLPGWRLVPVIVKSNDDLRQEQFASQLIRQFAKLFREANIPVWLRPYDVLATSPDEGLVEAIPDTVSIDSLKKNDPDYESLYDFYVRHFGDPHSVTFKTAQSNFVKSMAGYAIVCYILSIKDRHNGNILIDAEGHAIHIDFGFFLANSPGNVEFERAPFKLTQSYVQVMGGPRSPQFRRFRSLCVRAFLVARKHAHRIILLAEMMANGNEHLPCFAGNADAAIAQLKARMMMDLSATACERFVHNLIDASLDNWSTRWYDKYQRWCVGIF